jgi:RNA polymerase sigma-70 factor (ECF subfamily)
VAICSDSDLAQAEGFQRAFAAHHRAMYAAAFRVLGDPGLAQDAVQDVFLRVWRRPQAYDPSRGDLGAYLRLMARSRALDLWRESQVRGRAADRLQALTEAPREDELGLPDRRDALRAAVHRLPEAQREAVVLAYWGGLTAGQIARRVQIPLGTAKSRLRLGLARLREELPAAAC